MGPVVRDHLRRTRVRVRRFATREDANNDRHRKQHASQRYETTQTIRHVGPLLGRRRRCDAADQPYSLWLEGVLPARHEKLLTRVIEAAYWSAVPPCDALCRFGAPTPPAPRLRGPRLGR